MHTTSSVFFPISLVTTHLCANLRLAKIQTPWFNASQPQVLTPRHSRRWRKEVGSRAYVPLRCHDTKNSWTYFSTLTLLSVHFCFFSLLIVKAICTWIHISPLTLPVTLPNFVNFHAWSCDTMFYEHVAELEWECCTSRENIGHFVVHDVLWRFYRDKVVFTVSFVFTGDNLYSSVETFRLVLFGKNIS